MNEKKLYHDALEQELLSGKNLKKKLDAQIRAENVVRSAAEPSKQKSRTGSMKKWIAIPAVAMLLVLTFAVGTFVAMRANGTDEMTVEATGGPDSIKVVETVSPILPAAEQVWMEIPSVVSQNATVLLLPDFEMGKTYAQIREANGIPAYDDEEFAWLREAAVSIEYLDLKDGVLDWQTAFHVPEPTAKDGLIILNVNDEVGGKILFLGDSTVPIMMNERYDRGAQYSYSDPSLNSYSHATWSEDGWNVRVAQQYMLGKDADTLFGSADTITIQEQYYLYDARYLDTSSVKGYEAACVGVIEQTITIDAKALTSVIAEYTRELPLSGVYTLTTKKLQSKGTYEYWNQELDFSGVVLNETVQCRAGGLYVTLTVKEKPDGWEDYVASSLLYPSAWVAENMYGLSAKLLLGGETYAARVPWILPNGTVTFVFPVDASAYEQLSDAELELCLRPWENCEADGHKTVDQVISRSALLMSEGGSQEQPASTPAPGEQENPSPSPSETPAPTPEPSETPDPAADQASLPLFAELEDEFMWPDMDDLWEDQDGTHHGVSGEKDLFLFDWDYDGSPETVSVSYNMTGYISEKVTVSDGKRSVTFDVHGIGIRYAMLLDLDPSSPHKNLVLVIWEGEGWPYETYSLYPDGDSIKIAKLDWYSEWTDGALVAEEEYGFLGDVSGTRSYHGDTLTPDSDWIDIVMPSEGFDRESLVEQGFLLHAARDIPCMIDGVSAVIPAGTYLRMTRYNVAEVIAEVRTEDGTTAWIYGVYDENARSEDKGYYTPFLIDGLNQAEYFDVLFDHD